MILDDLLALQRARQIKLDYFCYSAQFPIAAFLPAAVLPINIPINNDSDFLWRYTMQTAFDAAGLNAAPNFTVTFFDTGSGRNFQDQALHVLTCMGTAQLPFVLPEPRLIAGGSVTVVTMVNNEAAANQAFVTLAGFKVFYLPGYSRQSLNLDL